MPPADDGRREAIVDEINSHDHGNKAQGGQVELKGSQHELGLRAPPGWRTDERIRGGNFSERFHDGIQREGILDANLDRCEASPQIEQLLRPAYIHRSDAGIGSHGRIVCLQIKSMSQGHGTTGGQNTKFLRQFTAGRQCNDIRLPQPHFQIERGASRIDEFKNPQVGTGERVHSENAQVIARALRQCANALDERRGRTDAGSLNDERKNLLGQIAPDFEIRATGNKANGILKTRQSPSICHLNRQENRDADGYAKDVEKRQKGVRGPWTDNLPPEKSRKSGSHSGFFTAARCRAS